MNKKECSVERTW